jgi:hypothetical protein
MTAGNANFIPEKIKLVFMTKYLIPVFFFILGTDLTAQEYDYTGPSLDLNFALGLPFGDFAESTNDVGLGLDAGIYFPVSKKASWLKLGPQFMILATGSDSEFIQEEIEISVGGQVIDVLELPMRIQTTNTIIGGHLVARMELAPPGGIFKPYIQGMLGFRRFATSVVVYDESDEDYFEDEEDNVISRTTPLEDWVFSYGAGAGFQFRVARGVFVNMGTNLLVGGQADYYTSDDIEQFDFNFIGDGRNHSPADPKLEGRDIDITGQPSRSATTMLQFNLGVTLHFNRDSFE